MTVYVDDAFIPARVGQVVGRWSHLSADTVNELRLFAARIRLADHWFQPRCKDPDCPTIRGVCPHFHYNVVAAKREQAIAAGAEPVNTRAMGALIAARRPAFRAAAARPAHAHTSPKENR